MSKLVIFDLDGTLLDTIYDLAYSCNYALKQHGYPEHPVEAYRFFVGNGMQKLVERALPEAARKDDEIALVKRDFLAYYADHSMEYTRPYPGVTDLLETLQHRNVSLAVASNKIDAATKYLIAHYFPNIRFEIVLGQREGIPVKPDPAIVNDILLAVGVDKDQVVYVGDSGVDVETALSAGVSLVAVLWGFRPKVELESKGASRFIESPDQLLHFLD